MLTNFQLDNFIIEKITSIQTLPSVIEAKDRKSAQVGSMSKHPSFKCDLVLHS